MNFIPNGDPVVQGTIPQKEKSRHMIATASFLRFTGVSRGQCLHHNEFLAYDTDIGKPHSENSCCETYVQYQLPYLSDQTRYILAFS